MNAMFDRVIWMDFQGFTVFFVITKFAQENSLTPESMMIYLQTEFDAVLFFTRDSIL